MAFWAKSRLVFNCFYLDAKQSIRDVAQKTGFSKSSVHRVWLKKSADATPLNFCGFAVYSIK